MQRPPELRPMTPTASDSVLALLLGLIILPELTLQLAGPLGLPDLRQAAYRLAGFHSGAGDILFPVQRAARYLTYMLVHTGPLHLIVNVIALIWLWQLVGTQRTAPGALILCLICGIGAALIFAVIGPAQGVMVGASGALFGLLGVYIVDCCRAGPLQQTLYLTGAAVALSLIDLACRNIFGSDTAWQAHAGGFGVGAFAALALDRFSCLKVG